MPNNTKISDLDLASQLNEADLLLLSQQESESEEFDSKKTTVGNLAEKVATEVQFSGLQTDSKTITGAINEAAEVGKVSDYYHKESFSGYHWENSETTVDGHTVYKSNWTYGEISGDDLGTWTIGGYEDVTFYIKQDGADTSKAYTVLGKPNTEIDLTDSSSYQESYQNQVLSDYTSYKFENLNGETNTFQILYHTDPLEPTGTATVDLTDSQFVDTGTTVDGHAVYMSSAASKCRINLEGVSSFKIYYKPYTSNSSNRIYIGELDTPVSSSEYETYDWGQSDYYYNCSFTCSKNEEHYVEVMFNKAIYSESDCVYFYIVLNGDPHTTRGYVYVVPGQIVPSTYRGEVFNDYENNFALGQYSHAEGNATQATGNASHAEGYNTKAQQYTAHAEGYNTIANQSAHAEGEGTQALGSRSHTEGYNTRTVQENSHAEGESSLAYGYASHAEGVSSEARGGRSHTEGSNTKAYGHHAHAEGTRTLAGSETRSGQSSEAAHAEGIDTQALNWAAHAEGRETIASGTYAHAEGEYTQATSASHAEGSNTISSGWGSHTEGQYTTASAQGAHAEGKYTDASGEGAHAEGYGGSSSGKNIASGEGSHVEGFLTRAYGSHSHAEGGQCQAYGYESHVEGGGTYAYGAQSHAEGAGNYVFGDKGHVEGAGNVSTKEGTHVEGTGNYARAQSHIEGSGNNNSSQAIHSHTEGGGNFNWGHQSHIEGSGNNLSGEEAHVEGAGNKVHGAKNHGEGGGNTAYGIGNHAEGKHNTVVGYAHHAEGMRNFVGISDETTEFTYGTVYNVNDVVCANSVLLNYSYNINDDSQELGNGILFKCINAPGQIQASENIEIITPTSWNSSTAYAAGSVVKFSQSQFMAYYFCSSAVAAGVQPEVSSSWTRITSFLSPFKSATVNPGYYLLSPQSEFSSSMVNIAKVIDTIEFTAMWEPLTHTKITHVEGYKNIALGDYQHVQGKYNTPDAQKAFIIGNGSETGGVVTRSNAMTVDWSGNMAVAGDITVGAINGTIGELAARIPAAPTTDGTYVLSVTVSNGEPTYSWVASS